MEIRPAGLFFVVWSVIGLVSAPPAAGEDPAGSPATADAASPASLAGDSSRPADAVFPLSKGSYWVYEGLTHWERPKAEPGEVVLTWKMEVRDTFQRGTLRAALLKGHPADLATYEDDKKPGDYLILRVGKKRYYILDGARCRQAWKRLRDPADNLQGLVEEHDLFLELPVAVGEFWGETQFLTRQDEAERWSVDNEDQVDLSRVKGLPPPTTRKAYDLVYRSFPDRLTVWFVPGLGIKRYVYGHQGGGYATDLELIEYHKGD